MFKNLEQKNKPFFVFWGLVFVGIIGITDFLTGADYGCSIFNVIPILLVTWYTNRQCGLAVSILSAFMWLITRIVLSPPHIPFVALLWNTFIRLSFFLVITFLSASLKNSLKQARTDYLTSAINSRYFYDRIQLEIDRLQRYKHPFTIAYLDVDNFKKINDRYG
ncbi:MAG TPA: diguanylate cyclase, partial [Anaerolineales bacterium]|nr:diguanylate cyclase [Anaerolineales bacterium]